MKTLKTRTQFDWRFWFKLSVALLPIISTVAFLVAQGIDMFDDRYAYWTRVLNYGKGEWVYTHHLKYYLDLSSSQMIGYLICRNILMITTLGNIFNSAFFINSAINNKKEGLGKFDNYRLGTITINVILFIILFYNLSLAFSNDFGHMSWYNWMSWLCEHSIPQLLMIGYFFLAYPKVETINVDAKQRSNSDKWAIWTATGVLPVVGFMTFFTILGYILKASHAMPIFGEMSSTGYFPYQFMDFSKSNLMVIKKVKFLRAWSEFMIVMGLLLIQQIVFYSAIYSISNAQTKNYVKRIIHKDAISTYVDFEYEIKSK